MLKKTVLTLVRELKYIHEINIFPNYIHHTNVRVVDGRIAFIRSTDKKYHFAPCLKSNPSGSDNIFTFGVLISHIVCGIDIFKNLDQNIFKNIDGYKLYRFVAHKVKQNCKDTENIQLYQHIIHGCLVNEKNRFKISELFWSVNAHLLT